MGERWRERCEKDPIGGFEESIETDCQHLPPGCSLIPRAHSPTLCWELGKTILKRDIPSLLKLSRLLRVGSSSSLVSITAYVSTAVDVLLVLGHEKLTIDLDRLLSPRGVRVLRIPKSGGAVDLDDTFRQNSQAFQIRAYFYGEPSLPKEISNLVGRSVARETGLSPYSFQIGWETLTILRVGEGIFTSPRLSKLETDEAWDTEIENAAPSSALPIGSSHALSPTRLTRVNPSGPAHVVRLLNTVLAIVAIIPDDRLKKDNVVKQEEVKPEGEDSEVKQVKQEEAVKKEEATEVDEEDEDDVPFREEIGWREVLGFIVMFVTLQTG